jgi:hypothetical protein
VTANFYGIFLFCRNYSADSILESVDGDAPVPLRRNKQPGNGVNNGANVRSSMPYNIGGSMSQLPNQHSLQPQPRQRPTSTQGINYQHWLVQVSIGFKNTILQRIVICIAH